MTTMMKSVFAVGLVIASSTASAFVTGTLGGGAGTFATLSSPTHGVAGTGGTLSGAATAKINGGAVYLSSLSFANDVVPGEPFLAAGPTPGGFAVPNTSTLFFSTPLSYVSFLWGSPNTSNTLTVNSTGGGSQVFTPASLFFPVQNGDESFNQAVQFVGLGGSLITSLVFSSTQNSFEVGRFSVTAVPEPETYAMILAGLGALAFTARRRRRSITATP